MKQLKNLAGQTAIYGLSSIIGRFLNYLLVPLHTAVFLPLQFGIITEMYAYVAFLVVLLTYGMETAFFRHSTKEEFDKKNVFSTTLFSLIFSTAIFISLATIFAQPIADWLRYSAFPQYVIWFAIIVGLDAVSSIPLAKLRAENKAGSFAFVNIANVFVNIGLNVFFLGYCLPQYENGVHNFLIDTFYNHEMGVGYVFISNLVASIVKFLLLLPVMFKANFGMNFMLLKQMLFYGFPLLIAGLAGIVNETIDRIMLKRMLIDNLGEAATLTQLGIYGACYKISIIITLFIQAFRYAAEPFFFSQEKEKNAKEIYSRVMNYFIIVCFAVFLAVMLYIDIIKHFIQNEAFWVGLKVVPILLLANVFLGIYYNLSIWYKLTGKTQFGAYISVFGAAVTIAFNYFAIPVWGYVGSAWATLACYASMTLVSYYFGQINYKVPYRLKNFFLYFIASFALYFVSAKISFETKISMYVFNTFLLFVFFATVFIVEFSKLKKSA